jgi:hypothetical protein
MSTKAQITTAIDAKIRNKTPLVVKVEHADVEQLITDEMFPALVVVEWDGTAPVSPTTDIICNVSLNSENNVKFKVYFWKQGNTVYYNGYIQNISPTTTLTGTILITFPTSLYKPLVYSKSFSAITDNFNIGKSLIFVDQSQGLYITNGLPPNNLKHYFNGTYKVAN